MPPAYNPTLGTKYYSRIEAYASGAAFVAKFRGQLMMAGIWTTK